MKAASAHPARDTEVTLRWVLDGTVQGVGFRPFVYRLAAEHRLHGWVKNQVGRVVIMTRGEPAMQESFGRRLIDAAPPLARPRLVSRETVDADCKPGFFIAASDAHSDACVAVPADLYMCEQCAAELRSRGDRRFRYPFINCTQCGPRYTLIEAMPYDRANTSMQGFELCPRCRQEYETPADRRFHAEPIACPACGPRVSFESAGGSGSVAQAALAAAVAALRAGEVMAVKGIGGYHLLCDATNPAAVSRLRRNKRRPHKPLAVMFPLADDDPLSGLRAEAEFTPAEARLLLSPQRPIVLVGRKEGGRLAETIAPGLDELGVFLPYSPLHQLLLADMGVPLVATSGNLSGEPVLTDNAEAGRRLAGIADAFLHHDRPIVRPADDSVFRSLAGTPRPIRLGRGAAPLELRSRQRFAQPVLAVGGQLKNNIALGWEDRIVVSPHIGDMGSPRALAVFEQLVADLPRLYGIEPGAVLCDAHPDYQTNRWARRQPLPVHKVWHHHAHASAATHGCDPGRDVLVFTWDGVGLGEDHTLWGGEALLGGAGRWRRVASLRPFRLPGGDQAARQPWRSAASICWQAGREPPRLPDGGELLRQAWDSAVNCPTTSATGRLFDAAAALLGLLDVASFEGQGPMLLEARARQGVYAGPALPCERNEAGLWELDWEPLLHFLTIPDLTIEQRAAGFHDALARGLAAQARFIRVEHGVDTVALSGGVFQNRILIEQAAALLQAQGFQVLIPTQVPVNDAGISLGQLLDYAGRIEAG